MASISVNDVSKSFGASAILHNVSLEVRDGEFLTLLGPSGCGKSTLLRILAGLEIQTSGSVSIADRSVDGLRPKKRDVAMVFQSYALYPHMSVAANMALPLRMRNLSQWQRLPLIGRFLPGTRGQKNDIEAEVSRTADALEIGHLLSRKPGQLSGGQRQRVAVGRAMVRQPAVFLMDEPLSNLDAKLRVQMRAEIKELHDRLGTTFVYVTHDQVEAMTLSDRVAVMQEGRILQVASPQQIYSDPDDRWVAEFIGSPKINMLNAVAKETGRAEIAGMTVSIANGLSAGTPFLIGIRAETFRPATHKGHPVMGGTIRLIEHMGSDVFVYIEVPSAEQLLVARLGAERSPYLSIGQTLQLEFDPAALLFFDENGKRIRTGLRHDERAVVRSIREAVR